MQTEIGKLSLRKNDLVQVISGREKGKTGKIMSVDSKAARVTVEKVNLVKRHMKPTQGSPGGGILEKESSVHYSNVLLMCSKCNRGVRHGIKLVDKPAKKGAKGADGATGAGKAKVRVCKKCGTSLEQA